MSLRRELARFLNDNFERTYEVFLGYEEFGDFPKYSRSMDGFDSYLVGLENFGTWGGVLEITYVCMFYRIRIILVTYMISDSTPCMMATDAVDLSK